MNELEIFINRLKKIGIELELMGNVPWIYLTKVNGNVVQEPDFTANHGFVVAWNRNNIELVSNRKSIFKIIRKYK
jgi:hypothetical protein